MSINKLVMTSCRCGLGVHVKCVMCGLNPQSTHMYSLTQESQIWYTYLKCPIGGPHKHITENIYYVVMMCLILLVIY